MTLYQDCSSHHDASDNMAPMGLSLFSLYIFIEMLKIRFKKHEALLAIYGIATPSYRTIRSLLNIKFLKNLKALNVGETSIESMQIWLLR